MTTSPQQFAIPTNIITGFLGVGKTTAILSLLKNKPESERWAVLVNEFGEVGIDGSLMSGKATGSQGIFIREVPGGCMCCAAGLPMQVALNQLLMRAKPHRLLIEPTGLGHPEEILATLANENYKTVLDIRAVVTLVNARHIANARYTSNLTFNQQLQIADVIVANKSDLYEAADLDNLARYLNANSQFNNKPLHVVLNGNLQLEWLDSPHNFSEQTHHHLHQHVLTENFLHGAATQVEMPECGYLRIDNSGEGFFSSGWIFDSRFVFDYHQLFSLLMGVNASRLKAVFITSDGVFGFNRAEDVLSSVGLDDAGDSRIEVIGTNPDDWDSLEELIGYCILGVTE